MWTIMIVYLLIYCIYGSIWGVVVNKVVENKGYYENWFWWGFFFGFFALIVALTKPQKLRTTDDSFAAGKDYVFRGFGNTEKNDEIPGGWKCQNCGTVNASYVGTCGCGCDKNGNMPERSAKEIQPSSDWKCQNCGTVNAGYVGTCGCGRNKDGNMPERDAGQVKSVNTQMLYCTSCGKQNKVGSRFCQYCGEKID